MIKRLSEKIFTKKEKRKETPLEFSASVLSCWLITIATCILLDAHFIIQMGIKTVVWQTLVATVLLVILSRRWWLSLALLGVLIPAGIVAALVNSNVYAVFKDLVGFLDWWISFIPRDSEWYSEKGFYLIHTFINIGVTILYFAVSRITKRAWATVAIAVAFIVFTYAMGYINYNFWAIPFFVIGIFPLIASGKFRNKSLTNFKDLFGLLGERWLFVVISTVVAVVICLGSIAVSYTMADDVRTRYYTDIVSDLQSITKAYTKEQESLNISLYDIGLTPDREYVGGDVRNLGSSVLAITDLTQPTFVKVAAYDIFDGKGWINDFDNSYRLNGPWKTKEASYLSTKLLEDDFFESTVQALGYKGNVNIYLTNPTHVIPSIGQVHNLTELIPNRNQVLFDKNGRLLSYYGQEQGFTYNFDTIVYDTKNELLLEQMEILLDLYDREQDPNYDPESDFYKRYTKEITDVPVALEKAIASMHFAVDNEYKRAFRICEYFSKENGFIYTDTPPEFVRGDNIIEELFKTKQGHSLYYTTAMVAMTRSVGIPSRLAAGYRTVKSNITGTQIVDRAYPYSWVECYIPHIGWVTFDPTPRVKAVASGDGGIFGGNAGLEYEDDFHKDKTKDKDKMEVAGTALEWDGGPNIPLIIFTSLLSLVILVAIFNILFSQLFYKRTLVRVRYRSLYKQIKYYHKDILTQFYWLGFKLKKGDTIGELSEKACLLLDEAGACKVADGIKTLESIYYGGVKPTEEHVKKVYKARAVLEKELKSRNNIFKFTIKRRMLLPVIRSTKIKKSETQNKKD